MALLDRFLESLAHLEVGWTRTSVEGFASAVEEVFVAPGVGAPLPFEELSLEETGVNLSPTPADLDAAKTGVTAARMGIANYGSLVLESRPDATEAASLFPDRHVAVLRASDVVPNMGAAVRELGPALRERAVTAILATGPSATADMGALVKGAHGPMSVHVILVDDR